MTVKKPSTNKCSYSSHCKNWTRFLLNSSSVKKFFIPLGIQNMDKIAFLLLFFNISLHVKCIEQIWHLCIGGMTSLIVTFIGFASCTFDILWHRTRGLHSKQTYKHPIQKPMINITMRHKKQIVFWSSTWVFLVTFFLLCLWWYFCNTMSIRA